MASSLGNAMASTPALRARRSVSRRILPLGRMHPNAIGVFGNINRADATTRAMLVGEGKSAFSISVPRIGMNAMTTKAEGLNLFIIFRVCNSP